MTEPATPPATPSATPPATPSATPPAGVWHEGKIDPVVVGFWKNKGIDDTDPVKVAERLTHFYRESERFIGAPPEEMIRIPKANAAETDVNAYWQRIGVPKESKEYDLSTVKFADGKELDQGFSDTLRAALHEGRVPKDRAAGIASRLIRHMESNDAAEIAEKTAVVNAEKEALDRNWGNNKAANLVVAKAALDRIGQAAGLSAEQIQKGWDALSSVGGIGASYAMEMLRTVGARMGEAPYIAPNQGGGNSQVMSQAQAKAEIDALKADTAFGQRLMSGGREERRKWDDLHKVAYPRPQVA